MKKKKSRIRKPVMNWQTEAYCPKQTLTFEWPLQLLMICKLVNITPEQLLTDFIENISFGSWKREGRERSRQLLTEYFIEHGYGNEYYSADELKKMISELDAMALLFPRDGQPRHLDAYSRWRENQQEYWFQKWLK